MIRLLGLGNEILADDAFGILVAHEVERLMPGEIEVVCSSAAGFDLLDELLGASHLLIVDTILTGAARPGTIHVFPTNPAHQAHGVGPHFLGLFEVLALGRELQLDVPREVVVIAVEASDCTSIGAAIQPEVRAAIPEAIDAIQQTIAKWRRTERPH